jgi:hypothetical protein
VVLSGGQALRGELVEEAVMSGQYVRVAGNVYGPFSTDQLAQMRTAGRITDQTDVSADRSTWRPLGSGAAAPPPVASPHASLAAMSVGSDGPEATKRYLERLRRQTRYPFYRTTVFVASILGYVVAAAPIVGLVLQILWFGLGSIGILQPLAAVAASVLVIVIVTVAREVASMYADFVDSTLAEHARGGG